MPNITKYSKEYLLEQAIEFVEEYGFEAINARDFAKYMNISTQPIFRNYKNMNELKEDIHRKIKNDYLEYLNSQIDLLNPSR